MTDADLQTALNMLAEYRGLYPAFRAKPVGAPNSPARYEQADKIALEDRVNEFLSRFEKPMEAWR